MNTNKYRTDIITEIDDDLIKQWNNLWEEAENSTVFNSYQWFEACLNTYNIGSYELYVCYYDKRLVMVLPLCSLRYAGIKVLGTICNNFLVDTPFLAEKYDTKLIKYFFGEIMKNNNLFIQKIDDKASCLIHKLFPDTFFSLISVNPCVHISGDPVSLMSKSALSKIRSVIKKNDFLFKLKVYDIKSDLNQCLKMMFEIEQKSSKKIHSKDIFSEEINRVFFSKLSESCRGFIRTYVLYYNNQPIAYQFGFLYRKTYAAYQIAYLNEYRKIFPGKIVLFKLIDSLTHEPIDMLDFGGGISSFKQEFTPNYRLLYNMFYSKNMLIMLWWKFVNFARRVNQILFPIKHTRDHDFLFKTLS
ncbi:MAG: GNAT family N-acetyltransferase [Candidatus Daviesbacteria bacterium]|nr:GNAT family N-acetyltransferase [Candidatus Daviesbacteria bacterium]